MELPNLKMFAAEMYVFIVFQIIISYIFVAEL